MILTGVEVRLPAVEFVATFRAETHHKRIRSEALDSTQNRRNAMFLG